MAAPVPHDPDARERLLDAAQDAFAEHGFKAATVRDICAAAGANVAAVNYYFGDKETLYIETVRRAHVCAARFDSFPEFPPQMPPVVKLRALIGAMASRMHAPASPAAMKLMMREMADPGKAAHVVVDEFIKPVAMRLISILRELLPRLSEQQLLTTAFSVIGQCLFYRQNRPVAELIFGKEAVASLEVDAVVEHVTRFTLAALGFAEPLGGPKRPPGKRGK